MLRETIKIIKKGKYIFYPNEWKGIINTKVDKYTRNRQELRGLKRVHNSDIVGKTGFINLSKINKIHNPPSKYKSDVAVVFLVDSEFLNAFVTLLYTLIQTNSFTNLPKVVITIDEKIRDNDFVRSMIDEVIYYKLEDLPDIKSMKAYGRQSYFKRNNINNITFLKLLVFRYHGYKQHIFLDCDMLCINNADGLLKYFDDTDLAAAPVVSVYTFYKQGTPQEEMNFNYYNPNSGYLLPKDEMDAAYQKVFYESPIKQMNSGVLLINERMIGEHVYKLLVKLGQISEYYGDQDLLYRFVNLLEDIKYKSIPVAYNVNRPAYDYLGKKIFDRDKHKLIFHHYSGRKPWDDRYRKEHTWVDEYWLSEFTRAKEFFLLK
jgi:hypothetical protein